MVYDIQTLLQEWESIGIFDYVLPFLIIFSLIYAVLTSTNLFGKKNKPVYVLIAVAIGLMALRVGYVQQFFAEVFPRLGVGLAILLVVIILVMGFVFDKHKPGWFIGLYSIAGIIALIVVFNSFSELNWFGSYWWDEWGGMIIGALLIIGIIIAISVSSGPKDGQPSGNQTPGFSLTPIRGE